MGIEEIFIQLVTTNILTEEGINFDFFWFVFVTICLGYLAGLSIFYLKNQTVDSWFDKSVFDKTIISILLSGLIIIFASLAIKIYYVYRGIEIILKPEGLSIITSILASLIFLIILIWSMKITEEEKFRRRLKYLFSTDFPYLEDLITEKVTNILEKYYDDYIWGGANEPDIAAPTFENPDIFIDITARPSLESLNSTIKTMKNLKQKFPDSQFILITNLQFSRRTKPIKNLLHQFDAFFDMLDLSDFEEYLKKLKRVKE